MKKIIKILILVVIIIIICFCTINFFVVEIGERYEIGLNTNIEVDAVIVLGARVYDNGNVSPILRDRLIIGVEAIDKGISNRILLSGDHGSEDYDEVNSMREYVESLGISSDRIFMDHAGFSTYETMYRAKEIFQIESAIIVTQDYHLKRAVFNARMMGIEAYGIPSDRYVYAGSIYRETREKIARVKDFFYTAVFKPKPTYLGDSIPIWGDGRDTQD
ncbi:MAG: YdcF family protein [Clostridiales bacterium]|nr:YdcF family protein [Clostridiales bacterium]